MLLRPQLKMYIIAFIITATVALVAGENQPLQTCNNAFTCIDETKFKICIDNHLVGWEFSCPESTYCSENSQDICTRSPISTTEQNLEHSSEEILGTTGSDICTEQGKFAVPQVECKKYLLCSLTVSGLVFKEYECPAGFLFDQINKICSNSYICPESTLSTNDESTVEEMNTEETEPINNYTTIISESTTEIATDSICVEEGKIPVPNTECKIYILCTFTAMGFQEKKYTCPPGYLFDPYRKKCTNVYICTELSTAEATTPIIYTTIISDSTTQIATDSICIEEGKIPVPNTECKIYILCIFTATGFQEKKYTCPLGYLFDPYRKKCTNTYVCTELSTSEATTPIIYSTEIASSEEILTTLPDASTPSYDLSSCEEDGKIAINDGTCTKYLLCSKTSNGFVVKEYTCPPGFMFDPVAKKCSIFYMCPELTSTFDNTIDVTDITFIADTTSSTNPSIFYTDTSSGEDVECKTEGRFLIPNSNCTKYLICTITSSGLTGRINICPFGFYFHPDTKKCTNTYVCPEFNSSNFVTSNEIDTDVTSDTSIEISTSDPLLSSTTCATTNYFVPDCTEEGKFPIIGSNCTQYIMCIRATNGFRSKLYQCPENTLFNPDDSRCNVQNECTEVMHSCGNTFTSATTEPSTTTASPEAEIQFPECTDQLKVPINNTNCKNYFLCMRSSTGYISAMYSCPNETYFNPEIGRCSSTYECLETKSRAKRNTSPVCSTVGQFPDPTDISCKYFYSCTESPDGSMLGVRQKCRDGYYFDSETQECSTTANCNDNNDFQYRSLSTNVIGPRMLVNGRCTTVGRYLVEGTNCKNYVLCRALTGGTVVGTNFTCPTTTVFNQVIQQCTSLYTCPDSVCFMPGMVPNPNTNDCSSYIMCVANFNIAGMLTSFTGTVQYCAPGTYYNPYSFFCDPFYVCRG